VDDLEAAATAWLRADPDPLTRAELRALLETGDRAALAERMGRRVPFGTAGLRAELGAGPNRMNRLVVRQTAAAVAEVLLAEVPGAAARGVVVAHDARHRSADFAADCVQVVRDRGLRVLAFRGPVPTPLATHAGRTLGAAATLVVTASHNPARDNGLKVYWDDGAQILAPVDQRIAEAAARIAAAGDPRPPAGRRPGPVEDLGTAAAPTPTVRAYVRDALGLVAAPLPPVTVAVTSLHGVGAALLDRVLATAGVASVHHVPDQRQPDPDFPTVPFPNPEEPGAMDRVLDLAAAVGADIAVANDPDADRLAVAVPDRSGTWATLTGDQVGALLAAHLVPRAPGGPDRLVATTVVSSRLLGTLARDAGIRYAETLTGFKWLCRPALQHPEWHQVLAYEEALGYAVGPEARDKDGITAALAVIDLVARLRAEGLGPWDVLDAQARRHGAHVTANGSVRIEGPGALDRLAATVAALASDPPTELAGHAITAVDRPAPDVLRWWLDDGTRVAVRPSGTEPKAKYYCEAVEAVGDDPEAARAAARARLGPVATAVRRMLAGPLSR
jgi:phosphomannomutase